MSDTAKKYLLVVFLTLLVWAWADNAIEVTDSHSASLAIGQTTDEDLLVAFNKPAPINLEITVEGPSSKIEKLKNRIDDGREKLDFVYSPKSDQKNLPETYKLKVVELLNRTAKIKELGLSVVSSEPEEIEVTIEKLVKKQLEIQCFDENGIIRSPETISLAAVGILVKKDYVGKATISLTAKEIGKAQKEPITKKPYVQLPSGEFRYGEEVTIKLPSTELPPQPFQPIKIGFVFSESLAGNYTVELSNRDVLTEPTLFMASGEAFEAYKSSSFHILIFILDSDKGKEGEEMSGDIIYNFPIEYLAAGEIRLAQPSTKKARFRLIPIKPPAPKAPSGL